LLSWVAKEFGRWNRLRGIALKTNMRPTTREKRYAMQFS
jgi:hypothetical protein